MTYPARQPYKANDPATLRCDNEPCLFHHLGICRFSCHAWQPCTTHSSTTAPSCDNCHELMAKAREAGAKAERERVLQKLILCVADMGFPIENKSNEFDDGRACAYGYFMRQINNLLETPNPSTNKCRCLVSDEQVAIEKELEGFPSEGDGY